MTKQLISAMNRAMYFSIPEQKVIYDALKIYLEKNPDSTHVEGILKDFYRESFDR